MQDPDFHCFLKILVSLVPHPSVSPHRTEAAPLWQKSASLELRYQSHYPVLERLQFLDLFTSFRFPQRASLGTFFLLNFRTPLLFAVQRQVGVFISFHPSSFLERSNEEKSVHA